MKESKKYAIWKSKSRTLEKYLILVTSNRIQLINFIYNQLCCINTISKFQEKGSSDIKGCFNLPILDFYHRL